MHRKTTSRRENNRIGSKRLRAAERQAINGGKEKIVRYDSWAARSDQSPLINETCNGKVHKKKKKDKVTCPPSPVKKHQWLQDVGVFERYFYWLNKDEGKIEIRIYKMCVHCGLIKFKSHSKYGPDWCRTDRLIRSATKQERETI